MTLRCCGRRRFCWLRIVLHEPEVFSNVPTTSHARIYEHDHAPDGQHDAGLPQHEFSKGCPFHGSDYSVGWPGVNPDKWTVRTDGGSVLSIFRRKVRMSEVK